MTEIELKSPADDPTAIQGGEPDAFGERIRRASLKRLAEAGFRPAATLPTAGHRRYVPGKLRAVEEVARRLLGLQALVAWVVAPPDQVSDEEILGFVKRSRLRSALTAEELEVLDTPRSASVEQYAGSVGWKMENMWPLAWALGFELAPTPSHGMVGGEVMGPLFREFLPDMKGDLTSFVGKLQMRTREAVVELEDEFYCAHNAVRSAQQGDTSAVPEGFHPVSEGGVVHERRHSLTWILSPTIDWEITDLST